MSTESLEEFRNNEFDKAVSTLRGDEEGIEKMITEHFKTEAFPSVRRLHDHFDTLYPNHCDLKITLVEIVADVIEDILDDILH